MQGDNWLELASEPLPTERALAWVEGPSRGAVACFVGTVRDHAEGRTGVQAIDYEAYAPQVLPRFEAIVAAAWGLARPRASRRLAQGRPRRARRGVGRRGRSTPHRAEAFEACRYLIDTLKATAPIWKHETWEGGTDWSLSARPIEPPPKVGQ